MGAEVAPPPIVIGKVVGTFGVRGAIKCEIQTDFVERFRQGRTITIGTNEFEIKSVSFHKSQARIMLRGVESIEQAQPLLGKQVFVSSDDRPSLSVDEYLYSDLVGLEVVDEAGVKLGVVDAIVRTPAQDLIQVGALLIPGVKQFVKNIDLRCKRIVVRLIPGMLDEGEASE